MLEIVKEIKILIDLWVFEIKLANLTFNLIQLKGKLIGFYLKIKKLEILVT